MDRFFTRWRRWRRARMRLRLQGFYIGGRKAAYLPAFLDRGADHTRLHRAECMAHDRGFRYEQSVMKYGFNESEWESFTKLYTECIEQLPPTKSDPRMHFYDWELAELKKVFETFKRSDPRVCAILAHMMWYVADRNYYAGTGR